MLHGDFHHIAGEGRDVLLPQNASAPAGDHLTGQLHVIKPAEGADDSSRLFFNHF